MDKEKNNSNIESKVTISDLVEKAAAMKQEEPEPKKRIGLGIMVAVLALLLIGGALAIGYLWGNNTAKPADSNAQSSSSTANNENVSGSGVKEENNSNGENDNHSAEEAKILGFGNPEVIGDSYAQYFVNRPGLESANGSVFSLRFGTNGQTLIRLNWDNINKTYGINHLIEDNKVSEEVEIQTSQKVVDMFTAMFGQSSGYEAVLLLMEDGSVEYIPMAKALRDGEIKSYGKLEGLSNIAKFYLGSGYAPNVVGGGIDTFAQDVDGKIYSLHSMMLPLVETK